EARYGVRCVRHRCRDGAGNWSHVRRMDHGQLHLALDFLAEYSSWDSFSNLDLAADPGSTSPATQKAFRNQNRLHWLGVGGCRTGYAAGRAGQRPARRLVRVPYDPGTLDCFGMRSVVPGVLGVDTKRSSDRSSPVYE